MEPQRGVMEQNERLQNRSGAEETGCQIKKAV